MGEGMGEGGRKVECTNFFFDLVESNFSLSSGTVSSVFCGLVRVWWCLQDFHSKFGEGGQSELPPISNLGHFQCPNGFTWPCQGPGYKAMDACISNRVSQSVCDGPCPCRHFWNQRREVSNIYPHTFKHMWYSKKPSQSAGNVITRRWSKRKTCRGSLFTLQLSPTPNSRSPTDHDDVVQENINVFCKRSNGDTQGVGREGKVVCGPDCLPLE